MANRDRSPYLPLAAKLLFCCVVALVVTGGLITVIGQARAFQMLAGVGGAAKEAVLDQATREGRLGIWYGAIVAAILILPGIVALIMCRHNARQARVIDRSAANIGEPIPPAAYLAALFALPVIFGWCYALRAVVEVVKLKGGETLPAIMGLDAPALMQVCSLSALLALLILVYLAIRTLARK